MKIISIATNVLLLTVLISPGLADIFILFLSFCFHGKNHVEKIEIEKIKEK